MKTLYLDCSMGAAGDMLTAALLELLDDRDAFVRELNEIGIPDVEFTAEPAEKCGITGTHMSVKVHGVEEDEHLHDHEHHHDHDHEHEHSHGHGHHHSHNSMHGIEHIVNDHMFLSERVREDVLSVYKLIAEAESQVHGMPVDEIHFHEVGTMDAVADVTAVCMLIEKLAPDQIIASPVHVGAGTVKCAHGILPVPAPATALILRNVPIYGGAIQSELCTPTGAALLKHFVQKYESMPVMKIKKVGYGMGKKDFPQANCVRAILGESRDQTDLVLELSCNVDDMTAEEISFATEQLMACGARDVYTIGIGMKKSRPGTLIRVICTPDQRDMMVEKMFLYTTTLGIRQTETKRFTLHRSLDIVETEFGQVRIKRSSGYGVNKAKLEYDDIAEIAKEKGLGIREVRNLLADKIK
ncbi:MAG: nickel pincer cofactor biosynthesis protein LarC [Erysipelotrichaceae bacterium]|nr:nickel pincer cofactor biosynthesis protein LarC [Erysipelotrichaceae bacterium]